LDVVSFLQDSNPELRLSKAIIYGKAGTEDLVDPTGQSLRKFFPPEVRVTCNLPSDDIDLRHVTVS